MKIACGNMYLESFKVVAVLGLENIWQDYIIKSKNGPEMVKDEYT